MRVLPLLLVLAACTAPAPDVPSADAPSADSPAAEAPAATPDAEALESPPFDPQEWMRAVDAAETEAEQIALTDRLLDAVDWRTACGEDDPTAPGRGTLALAHLDDTWSLAAITCQEFPLQSTFALVDARGGRPPRLVRALGVDEDGVPTADTTASFFGVLSHDRDTAPSRFRILTRGAEHDGCGIDVRYQLQADGGAQIEHVRARADCDDPRPPDAWPVTFARD